MPILNVKDHIAKMRSDIASAKQEIMDSATNVSGAVAHVRESADVGKRIAKEMIAESSEFRSAFAEVTNGGPPLDTPSQS